MIRYKFVFGSSIPMSEARIRHQSSTPQLRLYFLLFAIISAVFHPSDQLASASVGIQIGFWSLGYLAFIFVYPTIQLACLRFVSALGRSTLFLNVPLELTNLFLGLLMYSFARVVGIPTDDWWDLIEFAVFNVVLFELAGFCYLPYVDRTIFPEVYAVAGPTKSDSPPREIFLRGSAIPVHLVEVIFAQDNGVQATGQGQSAFIARPFGLVVSELPVDLGFQIHRSLWVSRDLALNFVSEGRRHFIQLPDGRRFPIARSRQREYRNWLALNRREQSALS